jgi:hypothetical protein
MVKLPETVLQFGQSLKHVLDVIFPFKPGLISDDAVGETPINRDISRQMPEIADDIADLDMPFHRSGCTHIFVPAIRM